MRAKVEKAATELGYKFDPASLRRRAKHAKTDSLFIGVFLRRPIENGGKNVPTYLDGMSRIASEQNVSLVVQEWRYADDPCTLLDQATQPPALRDGLISGVALGGEWPVEVVNAIGQRQPTVLFPQSVACSQVDVVGMDNIVIMFQIVDRLCQLGHQRIGFVGRCQAMAWASERFAGYVNALDRLGIPYRPEWVIDIDETPMLNEGHEDYWRQRLDRVESLRNDEGVEAWVCSSDWPAFQLYRGMVDRGYDLPKDLSITGFDDTEPVHLGCPPVTSVRVPREVIGEAALRRLLHLVEQPQSQPCQSNFPCELRLNGTIDSPSYLTSTREDPEEIAV
jgi:DNA-binding LacI/PurR family transcriptional regulator